MTKNTKIAIFVSVAIVLLIILIAVIPEIVKYIDEKQSCCHCKW